MRGTRQLCQERSPAFGQKTVRNPEENKGPLKLIPLEAGGSEIHRNWRRDVRKEGFEDFVRKAAEFLDHQIHLLILDLQPTTSRDPQGIHGAIWDEVAGQEYVRPADKPLTLAAYESGAGVRAFIEPVGVGDTLIDMPLFLDSGRYVAVPLEETYRTAFDSVPRRWRTMLEPR